MNLATILYFVPSVATLYLMVTWRTIYLGRIKALLRPHRGPALKDWLAVYTHLGLQLEEPAAPPRGSIAKPWRIIGAVVLVLCSVALFLSPLRFSIPFSFAQYRWDLFPLVKPLVAGAFLAVSLPVAFSRYRTWSLTRCEPSVYPFVEWKKVTRRPKKSEKERK